MKRINKILIYLVCSMFLIVPITIHAATFSISSSAGSVAPGGRFRVTVSVPGSGMFYFSASNATVSSSSEYCDTTCSIDVTAGASGTATVTATAGAKGTPNEVTAFEDDSPIEGSRSVSVRINAPSGNTGGSSNGGGGSSTPQTPQTPIEDNRSKNNNLESLSISEGTLTPAFSADTTEYRVELAASVTSIEVSAKAADSKASVSGTGKKDLQAGENKIDVTVKAENGSTKTYTIVAVVDEKPQVYTTYDGKRLGVVRNLNEVSAPSGFEETAVKINGKEVKAWQNNNMKLTIVYLIDEKTSEKNFYIYDTKENKVTSIIKPVAILGNNLYIVDVDKKAQKMEGFKYEKVKVDNVELMGFTFEDKAFKDYTLIYVMDEKGQMQYFMHEKTQNTLQLYSGAAPISQASYEKLVNDLDSSNTLKLTFMILTGVLAITTIASVFVAVSAKRKR